MRERPLPELRWVLALLGAAVALACAAGIPGRAAHGAQTTGDEPQYLLTAISLAEDRDLDIADELAARRWRAFHEAELPEQTRPLAGGRRLSPHDPLLPLLLAVPVLLGGWVGAKLALAAMAGALAALTLWVAVRRLGTPVPAALLVVGLAGLSCPLAIYGTQVYPEVAGALAVTAGIAALTRPGRPAAGLLGLAVVALPWLSVKYTPVAAALAALGLGQLVLAGERRRAVLLAVGLGVAGVAFLAAHRALYGGWTPYAAGDHFTGGELTVIGFEPNYLGRSTRLVGLLVDRNFGLAAWQPLWLCAVPALAALLRRRPAGWAALALPLGIGWLVATFLALTMHGWWPPGRQVVAVLPTLVLALAWWAGQGRARLAAVALLGLAGVASFAWLAVETAGGRVTWAVDFMATANPLYRGWRLLLPDYMRLVRLDWVLHIAWIAALTVLAGAGWRAARRQPQPPGPGMARLLARPAGRASSR